LLNLLLIIVYFPNIITITYYLLKGMLYTIYLLLFYALKLVTLGVSTIVPSLSPSKINHILPRFNFICL